MARAFLRAGHTVCLLDDRRLRRTLGVRLSQRWMVSRAERSRAELVFMGKGAALELETAARILHNRRGILWYQDPPSYRHVGRPDIDRVVAIARMCDSFYTTGYVDAWRALGIPAQYLPAAADRDITPVAPRPGFESDVAFIGTGYDEDRARFLIALSRRLNVAVWGTQWEAWSAHLTWMGRSVERTAFAAVCSSSRITLGLLPRIAYDASDYASDRVWLTALAGGFYLGPRCPGADRLMIDGVHCALFDDFESCVGQAQRYIRDDAARERIRARGEYHVRNHHTFDQRVPLLLRGESYALPASDRPVTAAIA